jgi:signal transduction histidine kinase
MRQSLGSVGTALGTTVHHNAPAATLGGIRWRATTVQRLVTVALFPMLAVTLGLALASDHLDHPVAAGVYWSYLIASSVGIGLFWWLQRPASKFGPLLVVFGVLTWIVSWQGSDSPLAFDLGVLAEAPFFVLTFYLFLAFPMGRLQPAAARWLIDALVLGVAAFFVPWALFSPVIAGGGPLTRCSASGCPENVLQIDSAPTLVEVAGKAETYTALTITLGVLFVYLNRLRTASEPQRRALLAVAVTSLLFLPAYFLYNFAAWILYLNQETLDALAWGIVATRVLLPLGFLVALLQAERFAAGALRTLLERLAARPTPEQWRDKIAHALDDDDLQLAYYHPGTGRFRDADGTELTPPAVPGRAWVPVDRDGQPVAAMVIDETLTQDPELVHAASSATLLAVENGGLEGELRASRARILEAGHAERKRIERDLHDSTQQRLVALRIHLELASGRLDGSEEHEVFERLGAEVEEAIDELREVARGVHPQILGQAGVGSALRAVAARSAMTVNILDGMGRHAEPLETTIYFCCLECLQNASKHAGAGVVITIRLSQDDGRVQFRVEDDGIGFDPATVERGAGLTNLADRVAAAGGTLRIDAQRGRGTRVVGDLPAAPVIATG